MLTILQQIDTSVLSMRKLGVIVFGCWTLLRFKECMVKTLMDESIQVPDAYCIFHAQAYIVGHTVLVVGMPCVHGLHCGRLVLQEAFKAARCISIALPSTQCDALAKSAVQCMALVFIHI